MLTTPSPPVVATQLAVSAGGGGPDAERLAQLIVYILVVIALVLTVITVWYWNRTRPERQPSAQAMPQPARTVAPNQVVVPHPQAPAHGGPGQQVPASGPQWVEPQLGAGGPRWQAGAPAAGPQWGEPTPDPGGQGQPPPAQGPDWGRPPAQR